MRKTRMSIGAWGLLTKYGTPLKVAEAFLKGELNPMEEEHIEDIVTPVILETAKFRITQNMAKQKPESR
ncbi:MAG: hypothetical protein HYW89_04055 [Candidatus Sungiibacteriota bacterium]|uniref:Uncharacterized protein n=1 Tax=Candidatus Sungiibacteriota bacterium TaxID=2750080 RepID=A0A7T5RJ72_9BACT|nr:MAG: hypothetical protein HYW89_04055 [Candidatus Sungbacteria bacterium]